MMSMNFLLAFGAMICLVVLILGPGVFSLASIAESFLRRFRDFRWAGVHVFLDFLALLISDCFWTFWTFL